MTPRDAAMTPLGRKRKRALRRAPPALLVLVMLLAPALAPVQGGITLEEFGGWPPEAWQRGALEELPLHHVAAILAGVTPDSPDGKQLKEDLGRLAAMPEPYPQVGEETLRGLGQAFWHQQQALRHLSIEERRLVASADPAAPTTGELDAVLQRIDPAEVAMALAALHATSQRTMAILEDFEQRAEAGVAGAMAKGLGYPAQTPETGLLPATPAQVLDLVAAASGTALGPEDRLAANAALETIPDDALAALAAILHKLVPFASGTPRDPAAPLLELAHAIEAARPVLDVWAGAAMAHRLMQPPEFRIPDPDAQKPDLRVALPSMAVQASAPDLAGALRDLGILLGDQETVQNSFDVAQQLNASMPPDQVDAVARTLGAVHAYIKAQMQSQSTSLPAGVDGEQLMAWAAGLEHGELPTLGTPEADQILASVPAMEAMTLAQNAQASLLAAVEDLVGSLAGPKQASHEPVHPCQEDIISGFILAIDTCGQDSTWDEEFLLAIDVGGDDDYNHRAGAPFDSRIGIGIEVPVPVNILVDLDGSDYYNAPGQECSQGAACAELSIGIAQVDGSSAFAVPPVSILVDWSGDGTRSDNTFLAGNRSQGHASGGAGPVGILVERSGQEGVLDSTYRAGDESQGRATTPTAVSRYGDASVGLLVRLVGSNSTATAQFEAGASSQGTVRLEGVYTGQGSYANAGAVAGLINVAGSDSASNDNYAGGSSSQAVIEYSGHANGRHPGAVALLLDVAGPRSTSHDTYVAGGSSRGHSPARTITDTDPSLALFLDAVVPRAPDASGLLPSTGSAVHLAPTMDLIAASNDTYGGQEGSMPSYGRGVGIFLDLGGNDTYEVAGVTNGVEWPANDHMWNDATSACSHRRATPSTFLGTTIHAGLPACGMDLSGHDNDGDGMPAIVEQLWTGFVTLWEADPDDAGKTPMPVPPAILIIPSTAAADPDLLDAPYAAVLSLGAHDDTYGPRFSAAIHIELGGHDTYLGQAAAAGGALVVGGEEPTASLGEGAIEAPQRLLSFLLDAGGDDKYGHEELSGAQGAGSGGASGLLFDLGGSDEYHANHTAQGVGLDGSLGLLLDFGAPTANEINMFRAGALSQGAGQRGGVGLLVATGDHNTFNDEPQLQQDGAALPGTGASAHPGGIRGENQGPAVEKPIARLDGEPVGGDLVAGQSYTFETRVSDEQGDDLLVCWKFEHHEDTENQESVSSGTCTKVKGQPGVGAKRATTTTFEWNSTAQARTIQSHPSVNYTVTVTATDPGGQAFTASETFTVNNEPPQIGDILAPATILAGVAYAFQLPFVSAPDMTSPKSVVDWDVEAGHGPDPGTRDPVDWADVANGASARLPEAVPVDQTFQPPVVIIGDGHSGDPRSAIDGQIGGTGGDWEPYAIGFAVSSGSPLAHLYIDFDSPHHVRSIELVATINSPSPVRFSVEGVDEEGLPLPLDVVDVEAPVPIHDESEATLSVALEGNPRLRGVVLRQVATQPGAEGSVYIHEVRALGPGAVHKWAFPGEYLMNYTLVDDYGGRSWQTKEIVVHPSNVLPSQFTPPRPVASIDIAGRGVTHHVSIPTDDASASSEPLACGEVPTRPNRAFVFAVDPDHAGGTLTVDWDDGSTSVVDLLGHPCKDQDGRVLITLEHGWAEPGSYEVEVALDSQGEVFEERMAQVHVEDAFDLWSGAIPLMFIGLGDAPTWHTEAVPYFGIVDGSGADRYIGQMAVPTSSIPLLWSAGLAPPGSIPFEVNEGARPSLIVDAGGDDHYIMTSVEAFGSLGTQVLETDSDHGRPLEKLGNGAHQIGWVDCNDDDEYGPGDCVFLDTDSSDTVTAGDVVLHALEDSDVPPGGVLRATSQGVNSLNPTRMTVGQFRPAFLDLNDDGVYNQGDVVYLDDPSGSGKRVGVLSHGDIQMSREGPGASFSVFGTMETLNTPTPLVTDDFHFCFSQDPQFAPVQAIYLVTQDDCELVEETDVRTFIPPRPPRPGMTQGFGYLGAAALLYDAGGDDRYNAPGHAQGSAFSHGAGALIDLGGDDTFNGLSPRHPDLLAGLPTHASPRPFSIDAPRGPLVASTAELVQGAADEGLGLLVLHGGNDVLVAGSRSQGHGSRSDIDSATEYAAPDLACLEPFEGQDGIASGQISVNQAGILCVLGISTTYDAVGNPAGCSGGGMTAPFFCTVVYDGLQAFLRDGPRMGPGTGLLVRGDGSTTYAAADLSQGSASTAGRGGLIDFSGGFFASAGQRAQGYASDSTALLMTPGAHTLWAEGDAQACQETSHTPVGEDPTANAEEVTRRVAGQGPEPLAAERRLAIYAGPGGEDSRFGEVCEEEGVFVDLGPAQALTAAAAPGASWNGDAATLFGGELQTSHDEIVDLSVSIGPTAAAASYEVAAFVQPYGVWGLQECASDPLSGPVRVLATPVEADATTLEIQLDYAEELSDGPMLPAGCQRVRVFVRAIDPVGTPSAWTKLEGEFIVLPPPKASVAAPLNMGMPRLVTSGATVVFEAHVPQPLARPGTLSEPVLSFSLYTDSGDSLGTSASPVTQWFQIPGQPGAARKYELMDQPVAPGVYDLTVQTAWDGGDLGGEELVARVVVDTGPPEVTVDPMDVWWKGGRSIPISGTAMDLGTAVEEVRLRVLSVDCLDEGGADCAVQLKVPMLLVEKACAPIQKCIVEVIDPYTNMAQETCPQGLCEVVGNGLDAPSIGASLRMEGESSSGWTWSTMLAPGSVASGAPFPGGRLLIQASAVDEAGSSTGWRDLSAFGGTDWIGVDRMAPEVLLTSVQQTEATNQTFHPEPMEFTLTFEDCSINPASMGDLCVTGSGLDLATVVVLLKAPDGEITVLRASDHASDPPNRVHVEFEWAGDAPEEGAPEGPDEGTYELIVQAQDTAGNFLSLNPGRILHVDRVEPELTTVDVVLPEGQQWIKPGDQLAVTLDASEDRTWIDSIVAYLGDTEIPLAPLQPGSTTYTGTITAQGLLDGTESQVEVIATDAAGNAASAVSDPILFFENPPLISDRTTDVRGEEILVDWRTDRAASVAEAFVESDGQVIDGVITETDLDHSVQFIGLDDDTRYRLFIRMTDAAGHEAIVDEIRETPPLSAMRLVLDDVPAITKSGDVTIQGAVKSPVKSVLTIHLGDAESAALHEIPVTVTQPTGEFSFAFEIDSVSLVPESNDAALDARFVVVLDDRISTLVEEVTVRIDNAKPLLEPLVLGNSGTNGWFNRSVVVDAGSSDDTEPIAHRLRVGDIWHNRQSIQITSDGIHELEFEAKDAAFEPNEQSAIFSVQVDRTLPTLNATLDLPYPATSLSEVPLNVSSYDVPSGIQGHRIRVDDGSWTDLGPIPVTATLNDEEGDHWIEVEVADLAGNVQRETLTVILDRTAPELLKAQWIGRDDDGDGVLQVIARDLVGGNGVPAGIEAVRFAPGTTTQWGEWIGTDGIDALPIAGSLADSPDGVRIQFADRAGNLGPVHEIGPIPEEAIHEDLDGAVPTAAYLASPAVAPTRGDARTLFTFSAVVAPWNGEAPDGVWVVLEGTELEMRPRGATLDTGSVLYTASSHLQPSSFAQPHHYRIRATFDGHVVLSEEHPGPTVAAAGVGGEPLHGEGKQAPALPPLLLLAALAALVFCRRIRT